MFRIDYNQKVQLQMEVTEQTIYEMVNTIVREVNPDYVYLFGSQSTGTATKDSDVDFLVVGSASLGAHLNRWREMQRIRKVLRPFRVPKDILVYSRAEFQALRHSPNHTVGHIARNGKLLYERH